MTAIHAESDNRYVNRISALHRSLGIPADYARQRKLPLQHEAVELSDAGPDVFGRPQQLAPAALQAWRAMQAAAAADGETLHLVSAFRAVDYQVGLIERKLARGQCISDILQVNAAPGYSEHHTGCAIDIGTVECPPLEEVFEHTSAYAWLCRRAGSFGFSLSYPRDNPAAIAFEPWHWYFRAL